MKFSRNLKLLGIAAISLSSFVLVYATSIDAPSQAFASESGQSDERIFAPARMNDQRQFLNLDPERSSGSAAVRIAFMVRVLELGFAAALMRRSGSIMMVNT